MPRKPNAAPASKESPLNEVVLAQDRQAQNQLAQVEFTAADNVHLLAQQLGYRGSVGKDALMDGARSAKLRVGASILEFGAYLLLLKEGCAHGDFGKVLADLEIVPSTARNYMAVTRRLAKRQTSDVLERLGFGQATELLGLDDEQIDELAEAGATGELALDDVARMSVKDLRAAVRKERAVKDRLKTVNDELNTELALKKNMPIAQTDWPDAFKVLMDQAHFAEKNIKIQMGSLAAISQEALKPEAAGPDEEASLNRAREVLAEQLMAIHKGIVKYQDQVGALFDKTLGAFAAEGLYK